MVLRRIQVPRCTDNPAPKNPNEGHYFFGRSAAAEHRKEQVSHRPKPTSKTFARRAARLRHSNIKFPTAKMRMGIRSKGNSKKNKVSCFLKRVDFGCAMVGRGSRGRVRGDDFLGADFHHERKFRIPSFTARHPRPARLQSFVVPVASTFKRADNRFSPIENSKQKTTRARDLLHTTKNPRFKAELSHQSCMHKQSTSSEVSAF